MLLNQEHLEQALEQFALDKELKSSIVLPQLDEKLVNDTKAIIGIPDNLELLTVDNVPTDAGRMVLESIIKPYGRPVLVIQDNAIQVNLGATSFLGPSNQVWLDRIEAARPFLNSVIPAVGRIEVENHPSMPWLGTGWLIGPNILVTNQHVAREFGRRGTAGFVFRTGVGGRAMQCSIDFLEEYDRGASLNFRVESILWIASALGPDVALLSIRAEPGRVIPQYIALGDSAEIGTRVAAIGYPARDSRVPDQDLVKSLYGDVYDKKRIAPGEITGISADDILHDCTTLGGNSGSVLVDLNTGKAVGLHYSGAYKIANHAVPAPLLREILTKWEKGELIRAPEISTSTQMGANNSQNVPTITCPSRNPSVPIPAVTIENGTVRIQVPLEILIRIGTTSAGISTPAQLPTTPTPAPIPTTPDESLAEAQKMLRDDPNVLSVQLGYRFRRGWITNERVIAVYVRQKLAPVELRASGQAPFPEVIAGIPVDVRVGSFIQQTQELKSDFDPLEKPLPAAKYTMPTGISLDRVQERMKAIFHVSPDAGFPTFKSFLNAVANNLTATVYDWNAEHICQLLVETMSDKSKNLKLVTQYELTSKMITELKTKFKGNLKHVWAAAHNLFPSAYHIKVATRDDAAVWLSSGNWTNSSQPDINPIADRTQTIAPLRERNREWNVVIENQKLAKIFRQYIEWDYEEAGRHPPPLRQKEIEDYEILVPESAFSIEEARLEVCWHPPLEVDETLDVQPLLTPDWGPDGKRIFLAHATEMIGAARKRIYIQNQYIRLLQEGDNFEEFERFILLVAKRQRSGLDVRIILRRTWDTSNLYSMIERCKDFGLNTNNIRIQQGCHNKGIIVDGLEVMLGSHNLSNSGALLNRDASLRIRNPKVAEYFEKIFLYDWDVLAKSKVDDNVGGVRVAKPHEEVPPGYRKIPQSAFFDENDAF